MKILGFPIVCVCVCVCVCVVLIIIVCFLNKKYLSMEEELFYLTTHSTHFIYGYMASAIW